MKSDEENTGEIITYLNYERLSGRRQNSTGLPVDE